MTSFLLVSFAKAQETVRFSSCVSLTGAKSVEGNDILSGYQLWVDYVNDGISNEHVRIWDQ